MQDYNNEDNRFNQDFTSLKLVRFTLPTIFLMLFTSLYNWVDGYFIANFVGENAFAAANLTFPWISMVLAVGLMIGTGGSAIMAKQLGEGKEQEAKNTLSLLTLFAVVVGIGFTVVGHLFIHEIMDLLGVTEVLYNDAYIYLRTMMSFPVVGILQLVSQMFFIADGKPELGMKVGFIGGVTNIILDYLFIVVFGGGIFGAVLATSLGAAVPALIFIGYFARPNKQGLHFVKPKMTVQTIKEACMNGSSEMVSGLAATVTSLVLNLTILNVAGEVGIAAAGVITTAQYLLQSALLGFSQGVSPIISYNYGAGEVGRLKKILRSSIGINAIIGIGVYAITLAIAGIVAGIFIDPQSPAFELTQSGLKLVGIAFIFQGINIFISAFFTALSNGKVSAFISFSRTFFFYLVFLIILPQIIGVDGIWLAIPCAEAVSLLITIGCIVRYKKQYQY